MLSLNCRKGMMILMINDNDFILIKREIAKIKARQYKTKYSYELDFFAGMTLDFALYQVALINMDDLFEHTNYSLDIDYLVDFDNYIFDKDNYLDQWLMIINRGITKGRKN